jgi:fatty acid desaturase
VTGGNVMSSSGPSRLREPTLYSELLGIIRQAGLLGLRRGYYARLLAVNGALLLAAAVTFARLGDTWWQLLVAAALGVIFTQFAIVGHDAGHRQVARSRRANHLLGALCTDLLIGFSFSWWVAKHRKHHAYPNHEGLDPDISSKVIAFYPAAAASRRSSGLAVCRYQAPIVALALPFQSFAMRFASVRFALSGRSSQKRAELVVLLANVSLYLTVVFLVLSPWRAIGFVLIQQGVMGAYFGCLFAPNHKGMPRAKGTVSADFFTRQVTASRNVRHGLIVDIVLGGLNYQIEHHLFPSMPRPLLKKAAPLVREFCQQHGTPYVEMTAVRSYRQAFDYLHGIWGEIMREQGG